MSSSSEDYRRREYWPTERWEHAAPESQGMDAEPLAEVDRQIRRDFTNIRTLLVVRHGRIVFEQYYGGGDVESVYNVRSVTKSFISALIGIALADECVDSLRQRIAEFFPEYIPPDADPRKRAMTIENLLVMMSGLAWDERVSMAQLKESDDWVRYVLDLPMASEPGRDFNYNTGSSHVLSGLISRTTGQTTLEFAQQRLFAPLGIRSFEWEADRSGTYGGGTGLSMTAREMAKFGYLYLNYGYWEDRSLIPAEFVKISTTASNRGGFPEDVAYGYHWWVTTRESYPAYFAAGFGGQYIWVAPQHDLVVVITAEPAVPASSFKPHRQLITDFVVPAVKE